MPEFTPQLFELRNYQTRPGKRDELIAMFETIFQDAYAAAGTIVAGSFCNLDDPDRFVWIRAFADGPSRGEALTHFYSSKAWLSNRDACNATLMDASDSLVLNRIAGALPLGADRHPPQGSPLPPSRILIAVYRFRSGTETAFLESFERTLRPRLALLGAAPDALLVSHEGKNFFPRQSVRNDVVLVSVTRFADAPALHQFSARVGNDAGVQEALRLLRPFLMGDPALLRLSPTSRSLMR